MTMRYGSIRLGLLALAVVPLVVTAAPAQAVPSDECDAVAGAVDVFDDDIGPTHLRVVLAQPSDATVMLCWRNDTAGGRARLDGTVPSLLPLPLGILPSVRTYDPEATPCPVNIFWLNGAVSIRSTNPRDTDRIAVCVQVVEAVFMRLDYVNTPAVSVQLD